MKLAPIDTLIVLGRKLEELKQANEMLEISAEALESDADLRVLIPVVLMTANLVQQLGFEPLSQNDITPEFISQLERTMADYMP